MKSRVFSKMFYGAVWALILSAIFPVAALGQRRWGNRQYRSRTVIYQPRPYIIYQRRPTYSYRSYTNSYPQSYYGSEQYTYGSSQPYYTDRYYSYRYSQPYFANRRTYSWANPAYRYDESWYRQRHRRSGLRIGIRLR
ncbi:MAG: hypothetical protein QOE96_1829 [Blastocatellia bacterium]|jgi:hypothetical protein|nr:hypothetical protein [Blastocatellia bacterium]